MNPETMVYWVIYGVIGGIGTFLIGFCMGIIFESSAWEAALRERREKRARWREWQD